MQRPHPHRMDNLIGAQIYDCYACLVDIRPYSTVSLSHSAQITTTPQPCPSTPRDMGENVTTPEGSGSESDAVESGIL